MGKVQNLWLEVNLKWHVKVEHLQCNYLKTIKNGRKGWTLQSNLIKKCGGWMSGWVDGCMDCLKAILRIACSNQQIKRGTGAHEYFIKSFPDTKIKTPNN